MGAFFKKKSFALLLIVSVAFFVPAPVAHADAVVDFVSSAATSLINAVVDVLSAAVSIAVPVLAIGGVVATGGIAGGIVTSIGGGSTLYLLCEVGILCSSGGGSGVMLVSVSATSVGSTCNLQIPTTFYNPRMNVNYTWVGSEYLQDASFTETDRQVAIYRLTLPADSDQLTLNDWFVNQIKLKGGFGDGWLDLPFQSNRNNSYDGGETYEYTSSMYGYWESLESEPLAIVNYSDLCSGNICHFTDATAPGNSYVAYVAKVLGDYTYPLSGDGSYTEDGRVFVARANKFFNNDNSSITRFPEGDLGNAIVGPYKTGTAVCPFNLSVSKIGTGSGTVTSIPAGVSCGSDCSAPFDSGTIIALTAVPSSNSVFKGWSIADQQGCSASWSNTCNLNPLISDKNAIATFELKTLNVNFGTVGSLMRRETYWSWGTKTRFRTTLKVDVGGTAQGPVTYIFSCGNGTTQSYTNTPTSSDGSDSKSHDCLYSSQASVTASVRVIRDGLTVDRGLALSGSPYTTINFFATPTTGPTSASSPFTTTVTAQVGGTATGPINYNFSCMQTPNRSDLSTNYQDTGTSATQISHTCTYYSPGSRSPYVAVTRGGSSAIRYAGVTITTPSSCSNGAINPTACDACASGQTMVAGSCVANCTNGATNPSACNICPSGQTLVAGACVNNCGNLAVNPPVCTINNSGACLNGATNPPVCDLFPTPPPSCQVLNVNKSDIRTGEKVELTWVCKDAVSCTELPNTDGFSTNGGRLNGTDNSVTPSVTSGEVRYGLSCSSAVGSRTFTFPPVTVHAPEASISANKTRVQAGTSVTLTGVGTDVVGCSITDSLGGTPQTYSASPSGSWHKTPNVSPATQTTYTLTCQVDAGSPVTDSVTVNVVPLFQEF